MDCRSDDSDECFPEFDVLPVDYRREVGSTLSSASLILPHCDNVGLNLSCICFFYSQWDTKLAEDFSIRYDTRCYFYVRSKAGISQLNLAHGTKN